MDPAQSDSADEALAYRIEQTTKNLAYLSSFPERTEHDEWVGGTNLGFLFELSHLLGEKLPAETNSATTPS